MHISSALKKLINLSNLSTNIYLQKKYIEILAQIIYKKPSHFLSFSFSLNFLNEFFALLSMIIC